MDATRAGGENANADDDDDDDDEEEEDNAPIPQRATTATKTDRYEETGWVRDGIDADQLLLILRRLRLRLRF